MEHDTAEEKVAVGAAVFLIIIVVVLYLTPWLVPFFYDMPEGFTVPYYALLLAIEMAPTTAMFKSSVNDKREH